MESRAEVVAKDLEEINGRFDRHKGEINCLKIREKDAKEETKQLKGFIVGMRLRSSRTAWTGWRTTSAGVAELLQRLGKSSFCRRMRVGLNCPMLRSGRASMSLLWWRTLSLYPFLLQLLVVKPPTPLFHPLKRLLKNLPSFAKTSMAC